MFHGLVGDAGLAAAEVEVLGPASDVGAVSTSSPGEVVCDPWTDLCSIFEDDDDEPTGDALCDA